MDPGLIELFVDGTENALPDSGRLDGLGLGSGSVVFMLFRQGWRWEESGGKIALSGEGLVATRTAQDYKFGPLRLVVLCSQRLVGEGFRLRLVYYGIGF